MNLDKPMTESERAKEAVLASMKQDKWAEIQLVAHPDGTLEFVLDSPLGQVAGFRADAKEIQRFMSRCLRAIMKRASGGGRK